MINKPCNIDVIFKAKNVTIIEKCEGDSVRGVKIKADGVEFWLAIDNFNALFEEENKYF